jgi:hypothetical protein
MKSTKTIITKQHLMNGKVRKERSLQKEILMIKISKRKMHTIFARKDCGREDKKNVNREIYSSKNNLCQITQLHPNLSI